MAADKATWAIKPHTSAKHEILRKHLGAWFPILASPGHYRRIIYLDGFAGPGVYSDGEQGSPFVALKALLDHPLFNRWSKTEFVFIFIEANRERCQVLHNEVAKFWNNRKEGKSDNVSVDIFNGVFTDSASQILAEYRLNRVQTPTFAFIDPFGWSDTPMTAIRNLLSFSDKCEMLFSFMYDSINRFLTYDNPNTTNHLTELFDTTEYQEVGDYPHGEPRKEFIRKLYMSQLKNNSGLKLMRSFDLNDVKRRRTVNILMFGTKNLKGLKVMKEAMWSLDPVNGYSFHGFAGDQQMLFSPEPDIMPLRNAILDRFSGTTVSVRTIERFVIEETDYLTTHYKKQVLKVLEEEGLIECISPRKKRYSYRLDTMLEFKLDGTGQLF